MYTCDTCSLIFSLKKNLRRHMRTKHNSPTSKKKKATQQCLICPLKFVERSSLRRHERLKHKMNITATLRVKKAVKCVTFEPSCLKDYPSLKTIVPEDYVYKVKFLEDIEKGKFRAKFEIADCDKDVFMVWLSELVLKSKVTYRVKSFTKSPSQKVVFNKVYRCVHNTYPSHKYQNPHPKHTGCPATLTVRIQKCSEALSIKNKMANNNVMLIHFKAIMTLHHCHNHNYIESIALHSSEEKKYIKNNEGIKNINCNEHNNRNTPSSSNMSANNTKCDQNPIKTFKKFNTSHDTEKNKFEENDDLQYISNSNISELSDEFDNYILVENVTNENALRSDNEENQIQLLYEYGSTNEEELF